MKTIFTVLTALMLMSNAQAAGLSVEAASAKLGQFFTKGKTYNGVTTRTYDEVVNNEKVTVAPGAACTIYIERLDKEGVSITVDDSSTANPNLRYVFFQIGTGLEDPSTKAEITEVPFSEQKLSLKTDLYFPAHYCKGCDDNSPATKGSGSIAITPENDVQINYTYDKDGTQSVECKVDALDKK